MGLRSRPVHDTHDRHATVTGMALPAAVLCDVGGVLLDGDNAPIPGAPAAIERLQAALGRARVVCVTNTSSAPSTALRTTLTRAGYDFSATALYSAVDAAAEHLSAARLCAWALVTPAVRADLTARGAALAVEPAAADCVVLGDALAAGLTHGALQTAFRVALRTNRLIALGSARYYAGAGGEPVLDVGAYAALLEAGAGVRARVCGKPDAAFYAAAAARAAGPAAPLSDVVMVGDDVVGDARGAAAAGLRSVLVRTGKYRAGDDRRHAGHTADDVAAAADWVLAGRWRQCGSGSEWESEMDEPVQ